MVHSSKLILAHSYKLIHQFQPQKLLTPPSSLHLHTCMPTLIILLKRTQLSFYLNFCSVYSNNSKSNYPKSLRKAALFTATLINLFKLFKFASKTLRLRIQLQAKLYRKIVSTSHQQLCIHLCVRGWVYVSTYYNLSFFLDI